LRLRNNIVINGSQRLGMDIYAHGELAVRYHNQFYNYVMMLSAIQASYSRFHLASLKAALESGETLRFEPASLDGLGLQYKGKSISWDYMKTVRLSDNQMEIVLSMNDGNSSYLSVIDMSNANLLYQLLRERLAK